MHMLKFYVVWFGTILNNWWVSYKVMGETVPLAILNIPVKTDLFS